MKYALLALVAASIMAALMVTKAYAGMYCYVQDGRTICCITKSDGTPFSCS